MVKYDFSDRSLIEKYWREKFNFDMSNYFVVSGWPTFAYGKRHKTKEDTCLIHLYERRSGIAEGEPAIYMGCGPWWNVHQNFEFSGMFAYLYIVSKCLRKHYGDEKYFLFCQTYNFPLISDGQTREDFDIVATLKEAGIAPAMAESENYLSMLDAVIPFMKEETKDFLDRLSETLHKEIDKHLDDLREWVSTTKDEILSFYGLRVRKEYMPEGSSYSAKYFILQPMTWMASRYGVYSINDLVSKKLDRALWSYGDITEMDGPLVPHYKDLEFMKEQDLKSHHTSWKEEPFPELTAEEKKENELYNFLINLHLDDEPYTKDGKVGLKDCWGRVVVPARFEDCRGVCMARQLYQHHVCVSVKQDGKWALFRRGTDEELVTFYKYDEINVNFYGYYILKKDGKYGLSTGYGRQLLPVQMDDIYQPTLDWHILFKQDGKYGILFNNGTRTQELFDELDLESGTFLSVRIGEKWGYLDERGGFVKDRRDAYLTRKGFAFDSMVHYKNGFPDDIDLDNMDLSDYITLDEFMENMKKKICRFSNRMDDKGSSLADKAKVEMGMFKMAFYYTLLPGGETFCVDMERPYRLKLLDDRYHDMILSWDGYEKEREMLKVWLNEPNRRTGKLNWVEMMYDYCHHPFNQNKQFRVSYGFRKLLNHSVFTEPLFEQYDFPRIEFHV